MDPREAQSPGRLQQGSDAGRHILDSSPATVWRMNGGGGWGLQREARPHVHQGGSSIITLPLLQFREVAGLMVASH